MPTYEYECTKCGHEFEKFQSISDEPVKRCPKCRCKVRKLLSSGAGILFKGSGFYQTDYRSESYKKGAKADSDASSKKSDGGGSKKSEKSAASSKKKESS